MKATIEKYFSLTKKYVKDFWNYIWYDDSLGSYIANFIVALLFIKFIFFPGLGLLLGTDVPVVAVVSGSMEHELDEGKVCGRQIGTTQSQSLSFDNWWQYCGGYYQDNFDISKEEFSNFDFINGLDIGDVIILTGKEPEDIDVGEVLVFIPGNKNWYEENGPVIHRVVEKNQVDGEYVFTTKGDNNAKVSPGNFERNIREEQILAVASFKIPYLGYLKVWLSQLLGVFL